MSLTVDGTWKTGVWDPSVWANGIWYEPVTTKKGGIVKYRRYDENERLSVIEYQKRRREIFIEEEEILSVIIAMAHRMLH